LEVRPTNEAAIALYTRMGFNEVGVRCAYYPGHKGKEDALILARSLVP
jgi:ribosomal-protein-alanine N-acetyltransferase